MLKQATPIDVTIPDDGISIFESIHGPSFRMTPRVDPFDKLFLIGRGEVEVVSGDRTARAAEGSAVYVPRGLEHQINDIAASTLFLLCFSDDLGSGIREWSFIRDQLGRNVRVWRALPFESALLPLWRRMLSEQERETVGSRTLLKTEALGLIVKLARSREPAAEGQPPVARLIEEIERTSFEPWTVDEAANWMDQSRRQFTKTFKQATGQTFVEALTVMRITRVKELLMSGGYTVAGAAYTCGFGDIAHFYRTFKRYEGQTPLEWLSSNV